MTYHKIHKETPFFNSDLVNPRKAYIAKIFQLLSELTRDQLLFRALPAEVLETLKSLHKVEDDKDEDKSAWRHNNSFLEVLGPIGQSPTVYLENFDKLYKRKFSEKKPSPPLRPEPQPLQDDNPITSSPFKTVTFSKNTESLGRVSPIPTQEWEAPEKNGFLGRSRRNETNQLEWDHEYDFLGESYDRHLKELTLEQKKGENIIQDRVKKFDLHREGYKKFEPTELDEKNLSLLNQNRLSKDMGLISGASKISADFVDEEAELRQRERAIQDSFLNISGINMARNEENELLHDRSAGFRTAGEPVGRLGGSRHPGGSGDPPSSPPPPHSPPPSRPGDGFGRGAPGGDGSAGGSRSGHFPGRPCCCTHVTKERQLRVINNRREEIRKAKEDIRKDNKEKLDEQMRKLKLLRKRMEFDPSKPETFRRFYTAFHHKIKVLRW